MKTQIKRLSKSTLAIVMAICMLFSCLMVGTFTTNAATTYYYRGDGVSGASWNSGKSFTQISNTNYYYIQKTNSGDFKITTSQTSWDNSETKAGVDSSLGDCSNTLGGGGDNNTTDSNTGTHYLVYDSNKNRVWAVKNDPSKAKYYTEFSDIYNGSGSNKQAKYGRVYFNSSTANWSNVSKVYFVVGHASWIKAYQMTAMSNTKLYGFQLNDDSGFGDARFYAFVGTNSTGLSGTYTNSSANKTYHELLRDNSSVLYSSELYSTAKTTSGYIELNGYNNTYAFTSGSAGDSCTLTAAYSTDTGNTYFNKTQTVNVYTKAYGSSGYTLSSTGGSVKYEHVSITSDAPYTTTEKKTDTNNYGALTSTFKIIATPKDGYQFDGFYSSTTSTTNLANATTSTSNDSYSYTITGSNTVYARFSATAVADAGYYLYGDKNPVGTDSTSSNWTKPLESQMLSEYNASEGTYSKTFTNLAAGTYQFYVHHEDGKGNGTNWIRTNTTRSYSPSSINDESSGNINNSARFTLKKTANSVKISFDPTSKKITVIADIDADLYYVAGTLPGTTWVTKPAVQMKANDDGTYSYIFENVSKTQQQFKITDGSAYIKQTAVYFSGVDGTDNSAPSSSNPPNIMFTPRANNATITIVYYPDTNEVTILEDYEDSKEDTTTENNVIYVVNKTGNSNLYFYTWDDTSVGGWPGMNLSTGKDKDGKAITTTVKVTGSAELYTISGLRATGKMKFNLGGDQYQSEEQSIVYGKTYIVSSPGNDNKLPVETKGDTVEKVDYGVYVVGNMGDTAFWNAPRKMISREDEGTNVYQYDVPNVKSDPHSDYFRIKVNGREFGAQSNNKDATTIDPPAKFNDYNTYRDNTSNSFYLKHDPSYKYTIWVRIGQFDDTNPNYVYVWVTKSDLPDDEVYKSVYVYAKDGMVRDGYSGFGKLADTKITESEYVYGIAEGEASNANESYQTAIGTVNQPIQVTTTLAEDYKDKYYVRAFCINGRSYEVYEPNDDGVYTLNYIIPETISIDYLEITPVYYLKDTENTVVLQISDFSSIREVSSTAGSWGNTFYAYGYYSDNSDAIGAYPGQPVIYQGGIGYIQMPINEKAVDSTKDNYIKGLTFSNGNYDNVHAKIMGWQSTDAYQCQTYDYDDFMKIYFEKNPTLINFSIKNRTKTNNAKTSSTRVSSSVLKSTYSNGFDNLTDYMGRHVDLFGTALNSDQINQTPVYVVSDGYVNDVVGTYGTQWYVYAPVPGTTDSFDLISAGGKEALPPSALVLNNADSFSGYGTDYAKYKALYEALEDYRGMPVKITYELNNRNNSNAKRLDGRWTYATAEDNASANIRIQYRDGDAGAWTDDDFIEGTNEGKNTGAKAYFTGEYDGISYEGATSIDGVLSNPNKYFTFNAQSGSKNGVYYVFDSWALYDEDDDEYIDIDTNGSTVGSYLRMGDITLVARFKRVETGFLTLSHELFNRDEYFGSGVTEIKVAVYNDDGTLYRLISDYTTGEVTIEGTFFNSNSSRHIVVWLKTTTEDKFVKFGIEDEYSTEDELFNNEWYTEEDIEKEEGVELKIIDFNIDYLFDSRTSKQEINSIKYYSYIKSTEYTYEITYKYKSRIWDDQSFTVDGKFYENNYDKYAKGEKLLNEFIIANAPAESNFRETVTWDPSDPTKITQSYANNKFTVTLTAKQEKDNSITALFTLPYAYEGKPANQAFAVVAKDGYFKVNGKFIEAQMTIIDAGKTKYFSHWKISSVVNGKESKEIANCYWYQFNFGAYQNCTVEPIYTEDNNYYQDGLNEAQGATVTVIEDSRNQWNNGDGGSNNNTSGDVVFTDFQLAFSYKSLQLNKESANDYKVGLYIEELGDLYDLGNSKETNMDYYEGKFESSADALKAQLTTKNGQFKYKSVANIKLDLADLDNKNQMHYYYYMYASANGETYSRTNKVFRAYAYIGVKDANGKWTYEVSETPVYFTMYSRVNG